MESKHPGLVSAFKEACEKKLKGALKRKRDDESDCAEVESAEELPSVSASKQPSIRDSLLKKVKMTFTQESFDNFIVEYIVDGVLPTSHVETAHFRKLMDRLAPGNLN